jgi:Fe-S-cluster containining protein
MKARASAQVSEIPVAMNVGKAIAAVSQLCPNCGLCCNGVLFADVELRKSDDARRLAGLGLSLEKKGRKQVFAQPCACFDGRLCGIYAERPVRCRTFECGLLKRVQDGELGANAALKTIAQTKRQAEKVRGLLRKIGQRDERLALTERYGQAMTAPVDLSDGKASAGLPGKLMLAFRDLMRMLQGEFLE